MLTPKEIEEKIFKKGIRGYDALEVDTFLDEIILDYEKLIKENEALSLENQKLNEQIMLKKKSDTVVIESMETAKKAVLDVSDSAKRRSDIIVENAKLDADLIKKEAEKRVAKLKKQEESLRAKIAKETKSYRHLLENAISSLKKYEDDLEKAGEETSSYEQEDKKEEKILLSSKKSHVSFEGKADVDERKKQSKAQLSKLEELTKSTNDKKIESKKTVVKDKETKVYDNDALDEMLSQYTEEK